MTNYRQYDAADFAADASFQAWVQHGAEDGFWSGWQAANPDKAGVISTARELILALRFHSTEVDPYEMDIVMGNINQELDHVKKNNTSAKRRLIYFLSAAAATVTIILGTLFLWPSPATVTVTTAYAETREVVLPDGSNVTLNANSSLSYRKSWRASREREVELTGEAFFKVTSQPAGQHPKFRVHMPLADVEVTGTAFNVHNRRNVVTVVLEEGKVKLNETQMQPGELATVSPEGTVVRKVNPARFSAWTQHRMVFDDEPLADIAETLQDTYGYTIEFRKADARQLRLTGSYPAGRIDLLIAAVRAVHSVKVERQGAKIIFE
jgi:ferric-dicitrate binding protein FerR (iron transport regulator)